MRASAITLPAALAVALTAAGPMATRTASAATSGGENPAEPTFAPRLDVGLAIGLYQTSSVRMLAPATSYATTVGFGSLVLALRNGPLVVGASLAGGMSGFSRSEAFAGGHLGVAPAIDHLRLEIAAEGGVHRMSNIGSDLYNDTHVAVALPYVGAHVNLGVGPSRPRRGSGGGYVSLFIRRDVGSVRSVMATACGDFVYTTCRDPQYFSVGGTSVGLAVLGTINVL